MSLDLVTFNQLAGAELRYARQPVAQYGTIGKPRRARLERGFHKQLEACLADLWSKHPRGKPDMLVSGGCYVEKAGRHGEGRAIDIDALWWHVHEAINSCHPHAMITREAFSPAANVEYSREYLGIEAILRQHFGTVLGFHYNSAHEDHWHVDNGTPPGWREGSRARVVFLQAALKYVFGKLLDIDGVLGKETRHLWWEVFGEVPAASDEGWPLLLDGTWRRAFGKE